MSLPVAIDEALKRGNTPASVARMFGVGIKAVELRASYIKRASEIARARRLQQVRRELGLTTPQATREDTEKSANLEAMEKWCALPIAYDNAPEPRWNAGAAARNDAKLASRRAHHRTLGGVADYSSREAA